LHGTDRGKVLYEIQSGVATLTLNNPEKANPIDVDLCDSLNSILSAAEADEGVKVLVLEGAGPHFSAGGDLDQIRDFLDSAPIKVEKALTKSLRTIEKLYRFPKPTIAKVHGTAMGGGCALALACDFVIAADSSRFGFVFIKLGIVPDLGTMYLLPRLVGLRRAKDLCYLGKVVTAPEALEMGMINRVMPVAELGSSVAELARELAGKSLYPLTLMKSIMQRGSETDLRTVLELESKAQALIWTTAEARQSLDGMLAKVKNKNGGG